MLSANAISLPKISRSKEALSSDKKSLQGTQSSRNLIASGIYGGTSSKEKTFAEGRATHIYQKSQALLK